MSSTDIAALTAPAATAAKTRLALVADDERGTRILACLHEWTTDVAEYDSIDELCRDTGRQNVSAIVLWIQDMASASPRLVEGVMQCLRPTPIVMVCFEIERWEVRAALAAGVAGVVLLEDLDTALWPCLQAVQSGQTCVPRNHWRQIEPPALSAREKQILGLLVMGYMNSEIAARLFLAESTIKSHLSSAFGKLGVRSRHEAVNLILDPDRGLGMGILALGGDPAASAATEP